VARARRQGLTIQLLPEGHLDAETSLALDHIAAEAAGSRKLGEMTFSVGRRGDPAGIERTYGLAFDREERLVAYVTWLWLPAAATMVLDEVKRCSEAPAGVLDLLIYESLDQFKGRVARASLGLAPITSGRRAGSWAVAESVLRRVLGISSLNPGLYSFKAKFNPSWERRYLVVEQLFDLPAALTATLLVHYPALTRGWRERGLKGLRWTSQHGGSRA
jgi:phosphatidylglycerol lysyltransferase